MTPLGDSQEPSVKLIVSDRTAEVFSSSKGKPAPSAVIEDEEFSGESQSVSDLTKEVLG